MALCQTTILHILQLAPPPQPILHLALVSGPWNSSKNKIVLVILDPSHATLSIGSNIGIFLNPVLDKPVLIPEVLPLTDTSAQLHLYK